MQLLCPSCHTPLPATPPGKAGVLTCGQCWAEVDVSRAGTAAGRPRFVPEIDRTGDVVGGYTLEARIGAGGMGTVYRASKEGRKVAMKFLAPSLAAEPEVVARFRREITLLEKLDHPGIVRIVDHGEEDGVPWFAMELVDGADLRARLAKGTLSVPEAKSVFGRLLTALAHAHAKGVVHRDLKPANVLLASDGAKLADFGIARPDPAAATGATKLTETAAIVGTFPYMSPEQRAGADLDRRSDLFSVGVMLYEALTGTLPQGAFTPPSEAVAGVPARVDAVVARLLRPKPENRYPDASEAAVELEAALSPRASMRPMLIAAGVAVAALAVVVPAAIHGGFGPRVGAIAKADVTASPSEQPLIDSAADRIPGSDSTQYGNAPNPPLATRDAGAKTNDEQAKKAALAKVLGTRNENTAKKDALGLNEPGDVTSNAAPVPSPLSYKQEANVVRALEKQANAPDALAVRVALTCDPTIVFEATTEKSKIVAKLPAGLVVDRMKTWKKFALLEVAAIGRAAGLPIFASEAPPPKKKASSSYSSANSQQAIDVPQQAAEPQAAPPPAQKADASQEQDRKAAPKDELRAIPSTLGTDIPTREWWMIRIDTPRVEGWIDSTCAIEQTDAKPSETKPKPILKK